ncbi:MAG TPA: hypothetical protein DCG34_11375 [Clostridiales bacterium]|nr:hypothetical protein [Clostridiales bacterium]
MKIIIYVMSAATLLMMFSTVVCGLWIKANQVVEASSIKFHATIGILTAVLTVLLVVLVLIVLKGKL